MYYTSTVSTSLVSVELLYHILAFLATALVWELFYQTLLFSHVQTDVHIQIVLPHLICINGLNIQLTKDSQYSDCASHSCIGSNQQGAINHNINQFIWSVLILRITYLLRLILSLCRIMRLQMCRRHFLINYWSSNILLCLKNLKLESKLISSRCFT